MNAAIHRHLITLVVRLYRVPLSVCPVTLVVQPPLNIRA